MLRVAHGFIAYGPDARLPGDDAEALASVVVVRLRPCFAISQVRRLAQVHGSRREFRPEDGLRTRRHRVQCRNIQQMSPAPIAQFGARRATCVGRVEHSRVVGSPKTRTAWRGRVSKRREEKVVQTSCALGNGGLALVQHAFQNVLLFKRIDQRPGRHHMLRFDRAPDIAGEWRRARCDRARRPGR